MKVAEGLKWAPGAESLAWALAEVDRVIIDAAGLPAGGRLGDRPESFEDRRREDNLFGAAPYEVGDNPAGIRWRDYAVRDELLINLFETRSAEPTVLILAEPSPCLLQHGRLRDFAAWWLVALGRWALGAGAAVLVGDERPALSCRGASQAVLVCERVAGAFCEARYDAIDLLPEWSAVFVVASGTAAAEVASVMGRRLSGRYGRIYALVAMEDLLIRSRRVASTNGRSTVLGGPAGAATRSAVSEAIAAGERDAVPVVPVVVENAKADYRTAVTRLALGGPP